MAVSRSTNVLLVEDHFLTRVALRSVLTGRFEVSIVAEAESGEQALELYDRVSPDVTLMDLRLPGMSGFEAIEAIRKRNRDARIVVLTNYEGSEDVFRALRAGAMAYLTKDASGEQVLDAILTVHRGMRYLPRSVRDRLAERLPADELTPRERQVLLLITQGNEQSRDCRRTQNRGKDSAHPRERRARKAECARPHASRHLCDPGRHRASVLAPHYVRSATLGLQSGLSLMGNVGAALRTARQGLRAVWPIVSRSLRNPLGQLS